MYKKEINTKGDENTVFENAIVDYYHTHKKYLKDYGVFEIVSIKSNNPDLYIINISPRYNLFYLDLKDTIGSKPDYFPTNYKSYRGELFVWNDENFF